MTFKKSWYSYGLWAFYVIFAFVFQISAVFTLMDFMPAMNEYVKIGVACLSFILAAGLFFLIRKISEENWKDTSENGRKREYIAELIFVLAVLVIGIVMRALFMGNAGEEATYFTWASVDGEPIGDFAHGAQRIYIYLLRGLFLVVGNRFAAGIILQLILQLLMALVWYFAIRKMAGQIAAAVMYMGIMLMPQSIQVGLSYSPKILYLLLFGIVMLFMSSFWNRFRMQEIPKWYSWVQTVVLGIGIGYMIYLDITGMVLIMLVLFALAVQTEQVAEPCTRLQKLIQVLLALLSGIASLLVFFLAEALQSGRSIIGLVDEWFGLFVCKGFPSLNDLERIFGTDLTNSITAIAAAIIMFMAALAFWVHKQREMQMPWFAVTIVLGILYTCKFCVSSMQCDYLFLMMILLMAGVGVRAVFIEKDVVQPLEVVYFEPDIPQADTKPTDTKQAKPVADTKSTEKPEPVQEKKINYIENPLPLPKKHTKRTMGYLIEVPPEEMDFDMEVSDTDDFDLK